VSKAITKEDMALLEEAGEMFNETGCVPGIDGEQVTADQGGIGRPRRIGLANRVIRLSRA